MTITTVRPVLSPIRTEDDSMRDWAIALALPRGIDRTERMDALIAERHSGSLVPMPEDPETTYQQGTAAFSCSCPRCLNRGPDRRA